MALVSFQKQPPEVFYNKECLEISKISQENTCARVSFLRIEDSVSACFLKTTIFDISFSNAKMVIDIIGSLTKNISEILQLYSGIIVVLSNK